MKSSREETLVHKESFLRIIRAEGREGLEPRHVNDPDASTGLKDGTADRHAAPNSLQESDPQIRMSLNPPCPPSPVKVDHMNQPSIKRNCPSSTPLEDGPTSAKRRNYSPECPETEWKDAASSEPETAKDRNNAHLRNCISINNNNNDLDCIEDIFDFIEDSLNTNNNLNIENIFSLTDERGIFGNEEDTFLKMFNMKGVEYIWNNIKKANCQHAFVLLKYKQRESKSDNEYVINMKGPYKPNRKRTKHSEDLIIEDIEPLINDNLLEIWIYTLNNPCLARKDHTPCMCNLIKISQKYIYIKINIGFSNYYIYTSKITREFEKAGKQITFDTRFRITSKNSDSVVSVETDKEQNEEGAETSAELQSTKGVKMQARNKDEEIILENEEGLSAEEELIHCVEQYVVLAWLEDIQGRYPNLKFFHINSVNLGNSANLANEE